MNRWYVIPGYTAISFGAEGRSDRYDAVAVASLDGVREVLRKRGVSADLNLVGPFAESETPFSYYSATMGSVTGLGPIGAGRIYEVEANSPGDALARFKAWQDALLRVRDEATQAEQQALQARIRAAGPLVLEGALTWDYDELSIGDESLLERLLQHFTGSLAPQLDHFGRVRVTVELLDEGGDEGG